GAPARPKAAPPAAAIPSVSVRWRRTTSRSLVGGAANAWGFQTAEQPEPRLTGRDQCRECAPSSNANCCTDRFQVALRALTIRVPCAAKHDSTSSAASRACDELPQYAGGKNEAASRIIVSSSTMKRSRLSKISEAMIASLGRRRQFVHVFCNKLRRMKSKALVLQ